MHIIQLSDIEPVLNDFEVFLNYIEKERPRLTKARQELGKKDCYAINELLSNPRPLSKPAYYMPVYPAVNLYFHISVAAGLCTVGSGSGDAGRLIPGRKLPDFRKMNPYSRYLFMFKSYWTRVDFSRLYFDSSAMFGHFVYMRIGFEALKTAEPGQRIEANVDQYSPGNPLQRFFVCAGLPIVHLQCLGFWQAEELQTWRGQPLKRDSYVIGALTVSALGKAMMSACARRPYEAYSEVPDNNIIDRLLEEPPDLSLLQQFGMEIDRRRPADEAFEEAFLPLFPAGSIDINAISALSRQKESELGFGGNVYILKVELDRQLWRRIRISASSTLHALHESIQEAYNFADDHLYAFFMGKKAWQGQAYWGPHSDERPRADKTKLSSLDLEKGQSFLYLFDFGDEWLFKVKVEKVLETEMVPLKPAVVESKGLAPYQYEEWLDDEF